MKSVIRAIILLGFISLLVPAAWASTVLKLNLEELTVGADVIAVGEVVEQEAYTRDGRVFTRIDIKVEDGLKGAESGETVSIHQIGGRTDKLITRVAGMPNFTVGETVLVFLERPDRAEHLVVCGLSQGKFDVALGPDNTTRYVVPRLGNLALVEQKSDTEPKSTPKVEGTLKPTQPSELHTKVRPLEDFTRDIRAILEKKSK